MLDHADTLSGQDLAAKLDEIAGRVANDERFIVEHQGSRFALVSIEDLRWLEEADAAVDERMLANLEATKDDPDRQIRLPFDPHAVESSQSR